MQENYKFVGVINRFGIYPDFVYPVFERFGEYYIQYSNLGTITDFKKIKKKYYLEKIKFLDYYLFDDIKDYYIIGDEQVLGFQENESDFFVGDLNKFSSFIKEFYTDDEILSEEIDIILDIINKKKLFIKKKIKTI